MCGENIRSLRITAAEVGSPPRVRGKRDTQDACARADRITPACAGKTSRRPPRRDTARDHPRVCGENSAALCYVREHLGSPPRVRGKRARKFERSASQRITPACAGKTYGIGAQMAAVKDHPRVCGENNRNTHLLRGGVGSPPRVRGKPEIRPGQKSCCRITPACAGKTESKTGNPGDAKDHPRVCGENV